jgi:hypothetical protein
MHGENGISIWFFIGSLLTVYGVLILGADLLGVQEAQKVVLSELRAGLWWGALLLALGLIYAWKFRPGKR